MTSRELEAALQEYSAAENAYRIAQYRVIRARNTRARAYLHQRKAEDELVRLNRLYQSTPEHLRASLLAPGSITPIVQRMNRLKDYLQIPIFYG